MASKDDNDASSTLQVSSTPIMRGKQPSADFWCTTQMRTVKVSYLWTIKDFNSLISKKVDSVFTETFAAKDTPHIFWRLTLIIGPNDNEFLKIYLFSYKGIHSAQYKVFFKAKISILNAESEKHTAVSLEGSSGGGDQWKIEKFVSKAFLMANPDKLLPKNSLTIFCEISQSGHFNIQKEKNITIYYCKMLDDFSKLFENSMFADANIVVQGTTFKVHKSILAARCPVFWAMFKPDSRMKEQIDSVVEIEDIEPQVFRELLRYIYTGEVEYNDDRVCALMIAADKYGLEGLTLICENTLYDIISVNNAMQILVHADQLEMYHLKQKVFKFIKSNLADVIKSKSWDRVLDTHVHLVTEIMKLHTLE